MSAIGKAEDRVIDVATIGVFVAGGYLLYKFLPELTAGEEVTKKVIDKTLEIGGGSLDVIDDSLSGDFGQATQDLYKVPVIGKVAVAVDKFFGSYRPPPTPSYEEQARADKETYLPRLGELEKFDDWKPEVCQARIDKAIRSGAGNLWQICKLHQNHLAHGVLGNKGSIARMEFVDGTYDASANAIRIGTITKDQVLVHASDYDWQEFPIGFAYYLNAGLGQWWYDWNNREQMVQILNSVKFRNNYTVATNLAGKPDSITMNELRLLDMMTIDVKAGDNGFLKFSVGEVELPAGYNVENPWANICPGNTECWR